MIAELFTGENAVYWIVAGFMACCLFGVKLVMINFDRKHKDKK